jgi:cardiolipin synthase (CMP-forming)
MTLANWITIFRLVLVPVCCGLAWAYTPENPWMRWTALGGFVTAALSDALDGYLARNFGQSTRLGAILDPLADKLLVNIMVLVLTFNTAFTHDFPIWMPILLFGRDALILGGSALVHYTRGPIHPKPRPLGKLTTLVNCVGISVVLAEAPFAPFVTWIMGAFILISAIDYILFGMSDHPRTVDDAGDAD